MKALRKRLTWLLLALFLLPVLVSSVWYWRQVRQQRLDHALIEAIKKNDTSAAIALLNQGADANATDRPYTPVTFQSALADFWNRMKGKKPQEDTTFYPPALLLPYTVYNSHHISSEGWVSYRVDSRDNPTLVKALLEHRANPYASDESGKTVLHRAVDYNHPKTVKVLLGHHVNPNIKDNTGTTPLYDAHIICARLLIEGGAKVSMTDNNGNTLLQFIAIMKNDKEDKDLLPLLKAALMKEQAEQKSSSTTATK